MPGPNKYFQIGFNKCGTSAIARFFDMNGIPCVHWDKGRLAHTIEQNVQEEKYILSGYESYDAFTDMEDLTKEKFFEGYKYFEQILNQVENSFFILNTRDRDRWIRSRLAHAHNDGGRRLSYAETFRSLYELGDIDDVAEYWKKDWDEHHAAVRATIPPERLLVFDIEKDSPLLLCEFAGLDPSGARHYRKENFALNRFGRLLQHTPAPLTRVLPTRIRNSIIWMLRKHR